MVQALTSWRYRPVPCLHAYPSVPCYTVANLTSHQRSGRIAATCHGSFLAVTRLREKPRLTSASREWALCRRRRFVRRTRRAPELRDHGQDEEGTGYMGALTDDAGPSAGRPVRRGARAASAAARLRY